MSSRLPLLLLVVATTAILFVSGVPQTQPSSLVASRLRRVVRAENVEVDQTNQAFQEYQAALSDAMVQQINSIKNVSWEAGMNEYFDGKSYEFLQKSCGMKFKLGGSSASSVYPTWVPNYPIAPASNLPEQFDGRQKWGATCPSLNDIRDQAGCGSCWAVAAASSMTDRTCVATNGVKQPYLSAINILTCCGTTECGSCEGGYPLNAWQYWVNQGVVTGGSFGTTNTCQPYQWPPCEHHTNGTRPPCVAQDTTPSCSSKCLNGGDFPSDKHFGSSAYKITNDESVIMNELMTHGPIEAGFMVFEDFPHYKSGVYRHVTGNMVGGHAVKILGWGVEGGEKYWLVANSWNTNWGDNGFFKIARGTNECMIEDMMFAGQVRV